jgi:hypothetical protein
MNKKDKKTIIIFGVLELIIGGILGFIYLDNFQGEGELNNSIIQFYLTLNAIFLGTTILIGTLNIGLLKIWDKMFNAILFSLGLGLLCLATYSLTFSFLSYTLNIRVTPLFFTLLGFVIGFNLGLIRKRTVNKFGAETNNGTQQSV